jgi:hypothetical protein
MKVGNVMTDIPNLENTQLFQMMKVREQINYHEKCTLLLPEKRENINRKYIRELKEKPNMQKRYQIIQMK